MNTKIIAVWPENEHPLLVSLRFWLDEYQIDKYIEKSYADKLTTPFTAILPILYKIFKETWNIYLEVNNEDIMKIKDIINENGVKCENSSVVTFAAFISQNRPNIDNDSKIIIVSTWKWLEN